MSKNHAPSSTEFPTAPGLPGGAGGKAVLAVLPRGQRIAEQAYYGIRKVADAMRWRFVPAEFYHDAADVPRVGRSPLGAESFAELAALLRPDGVIVWAGTLSPAEVRKVLGPRVPAVFINPNDPAAAPVRVEGDSASIAALAARELLFTDRGDFAFAPFSGSLAWSVARGREFAKFIALAGGRFHEFPGPSGVAGRRKTGRSVAPEPALLRWLAALPKPCGVFAANDIVGERVLAECAALGLRVPGDVAVVGVDDDGFICENTSPTLSSVVQDIYGEGVAAAQLLAERLARPGGRPPAPRVVSAAGLTRRASSRVVEDDRVARALKAIRLHACEAGFGLAEVVRAMGLSRAPALARFKRATGRTVLEEIHAVRLARARSLLASGCKPDFAASESGYASYTDFCRVFRKRIGATVRQWLRERAKA